MFEEALEFVLRWEGGFTDDPRDPGNWTGRAVGRGVLKGTNRGISAASYPKLDIRNLTDAQIAEIYRRDFWNAVGANRLSDGIALFVFDTAVNMGVGRTRNWLISTGALLGIQRLERLMSLRCMHYASLTNMIPTFGRGWFNRTSECFSLALQHEIFDDLKGKRLFVDSHSVRRIVAASRVRDKLYIRTRA